MKPAWFPDWSGQTAVVLASGPSLTITDCATVDRARFWGDCRVIAVNSTFRRVPAADVIYACDREWWRANPDAGRCRGLKVGAGDEPIDAVHTLRFRDRAGSGLETSPPFLASGGNSGHQALNLALQFGARKVLLLGFDFGADADGRRHWHCDHPVPLRNPQAETFAGWIRAAETIPDALRQFASIIINCSRQTAISCLPRSTIEAEL